MSKGRAVGVLVVGVVIAVVLIGWLPGGGQPAAPPPPTPAQSSPPTSSQPPTSSRKPQPHPPRHGVLVVKIDNVDVARPQTGVAAASIIYVEQVEGGLTRLAGVYCAKRPPVIGPVRSARVTDAELLSQYGNPAFAYSGAAAQVLRVIGRAPLLKSSPAQRPGAYYRASDRPSPHNLYVHPAKLPAGGSATCPMVNRSGAALRGGKPARTWRVAYPAASYTFTWSSRAHRWLVTMNGSPFVDTASGRVKAATVVVQHVRVGGGPVVRDAAGHSAPNSVTIGHGTATVLRGGKAYQATWSRPTARDHTSFRTAGGKPLPLGPGPVWVLLKPITAA